MIYSDIVICYQPFTQSWVNKDFLCYVVKKWLPPKVFRLDVWGRPMEPLLVFSFRPQGLAFRGFLQPSPQFLPSTLRDSCSALCMAVLRKGFSLCVSCVLDCRMHCRWCRCVSYCFVFQLHWDCGHLFEPCTTLGHLISSMQYVGVRWNVCCLGNGILTLFLQGSQYTTCSFGESVQWGFLAPSTNNVLCNVVIEECYFNLVVTDFIPCCPCFGEGHPSGPLLFCNFRRSFLILTSIFPLHSSGMLVLTNVGIRV